jgi:hypothetical protein
MGIITPPVRFGTTAGTAAAGNDTRIVNSVPKGTVGSENVTLGGVTDTLANRLTALQTAQSAGSVAYDTLAQLNANLAPVDGSTAQVVNDGANNGAYRKSGATGAGSWVRYSTATLTGHDALLTNVDALLRSLSGDVLRRLGSVGLHVEESPDVLLDGIYYPVVVVYSDNYVCGGIDTAGQFVPLIATSQSYAQSAATQVYGGKTYVATFADTSGAVLAGLTTDGQIVSEFPITWPGAPVQTIDDPAWLFAVAYTDDQIGFGIRSTGEVYIGGQTQSSGLPAISHVIGLGQSNEEGSQSQPIVTATDPGFGAYKFARGIHTYNPSDNPATPENRVASDFTFVPLIEAVQQLWAGETIATGLTAQMKTALTGGRFSPVSLSDTTPHYLFSYPHRGGKHLIELNYQDYETSGSDPTPGAGGYQKTFKDDITRAKASARAAGFDYGITAFTFCQGENEGGGLLIPGGSVMTHADFVPAYKAELLDSYNHWDADARAITGQTRSIPMFIRQVLNEWAGQAQVQLANEHPAIFLATPIYYVPSAENSVWNNGARGATVHMSADGQRWLGEQVGKVMRRVLFEGEDWSPLQPVDTYRVSDTEIRIRFNVPRPPLRFETSWLAAAIAYGFQVNLGTKDSPGAARTIAAVSIVADDTVALTLSAATPVTAGASAYVTYGRNAAIGNTSVTLAAIGSGAAYPSGQASTELTFTGDITAQFSTLLVEGCFVLRQYTAGNGYMIARDVRLSGGNTIVRGETREVTGTFQTGTPCTIERDRPFGNLCDSDKALSLFRFTDTSYGTRQGQYYPLPNFCVVFLAYVRT